MFKNSNRRPPSLRFPWAHTFSGFLVVTSLECFFAECRGRSNVVVVRCSFHSGFATVCVAGIYSLGYNNIQIRRFNALLWISKTLTVITSTIDI